MFLVFEVNFVGKLVLYFSFIYFMGDFFGDYNFRGSEALFWSGMGVVDRG